MNEDVRSGQIVYASASRGVSEDRPWRFVLLDLATGSQRLLPHYGTTGLGAGGRPVAPAWSPDGKHLLYSLNEDSVGVFLYDFATGRHERLDQPTEHGEGSRAAWSPDGRYIAYQSTRDLVLPDLQQMMQMDEKARDAWLRSDSYFDLYVMDLRTRTHRRLTTKSGGFPVWSPDGQWIFYYAPGRDGRCFRIRPDGSGDEEFPKAPHPLRPRMLTWSSDGRRIAFSTWLFPSDMSTFESDEQVYTADAAGGHVELLTPEKWDNAAPVWAPQGNRLAVVVNMKQGSGLASIRLVENGRSRQLVAQAHWDDRYNFWSPNGRAIASTPMNWSTLEGRGISILNLDDGTVRHLVTDEMAAYPVWRPGRHPF